MNPRPCSMLAALVLILPASVHAQDAGKLPTAQEVIEKYVNAIGGKEAFAKRQSVQSKGTLNLPAQGLKGSIEILSARPNKLLINIDLPGIGMSKTGYDGKVGWTSSPIAGPALMEDKQLGEFKEQADFDSDLHDAGRYSSMEVSGPVDFEGKKCYALKLVSKSGRESTEFFDAESGLMLGSESTEASPAGDLKVTTLLSDYEKKGDLLVATKTTQKISGIDMSMEMTEFEFDKVDPKAFDLPEEIKALVKKD